MKIFLTLSLSLTLSLVMSQEAPLNLPDAEVATSHQQVEIDGKTIQLIAQAGTYKLRDEENKPLALFGYTSYIKEGAKSTRPIVFAFNGGPNTPICNQKDEEPGPPLKANTMGRVLLAPSLI